MHLSLSLNLSSWRSAAQSKDLILAFLANGYLQRLFADKYLSKAHNKVSQKSVPRPSGMSGLSPHPPTHLLRPVFDAFISSKTL